MWRGVAVFPQQTQFHSVKFYENVSGTSVCLWTGALIGLYVKVLSDCYAAVGFCKSEFIGLAEKA